MACSSCGKSRLQVNNPVLRNRNAGTSQVAAPMTLVDSQSLKQGAPIGAVSSSPNRKALTRTKV